MRLTCTWTLAAALGVLCAAPAGAQPGDDAVFEELQTHESLGPHDDPILDQWLSDRIAELVATLGSGNVNKFAQAEQKLWAVVKALFRQAAITEAFKNRLAERAARQFADHFANNNPVPPEVARALVRLLRFMDRVGTLAGLQAALQSPDEAVRYLGAEGLRSLRDRIGPNAQLARTVITTLRDTGVAEENGVIVGAIYRALEYPNQVTDSLSAIGAMLSARANRFRAGRNIVERAEIDGFLFLEPHHAQLTQPQRLQAVRDLASLLQFYATKYLDPATRPADKQLLERLMFRAEDLLEKIVQPAQRAVSMRNALRDQPNVARNLPVELAKWIGATGAPGLLNQTPWDVPIGRFGSIDRHGN